MHTSGINALSIALSVLATTATFAAPNRCPTHGIYLQVLGSGGPELNGRAQSSYLVWDQGKARVLVDAGPGSAVNFGRAGARYETLNVIALTHLHADHSADLPAYVKNGFFSDRQENLPILGPDGSSRFPATTEWLKALFAAPDGAYRYLDSFLSGDDQPAYRLLPQDILPEDGATMTPYQQGNLTLTAVSVTHGAVPALAWRVTLGDRSVVFSGDTNGNGDSLQKLAQGAGLLVAHNAVPEGAKGIERALHMPPSRIGEIAAAGNIKMLLLSHRMNRTLGREPETQQTIRKYYQGKLAFANDFDCIALPRNSQ
ncbi:MBL fold metallo-hydrolase [Chitinimonas sp. BJB300]|uniref:MBL fold metallo-hydrolase n=1 Tax=Chitinimonas sp. BJB300 TaxID=1559339 RepID=UPI000C0F30BA|nr:MBL fold metallo-hydrolase [Chitinimonas sp. BJB300]PHV10387.1 MBL fold metallo-hydrolase [Chitinimonas sp. BJB300]TSJ87525.1 MBL fold metallo-hydrolase [Chitinimonas sp. BJB300]